jgi:uncharacterized protein (TIGR04255 family)
MIAISTRKYSVWENFIMQVDDIVNIFTDCYHPSFYTRIGLRYIDVIQRSKWGLEDCKWSELIDKKVLGFMDDKTMNYSMRAESINSDNRSKTIYNFQLAKIKESEEQVFMIDCDYHILDDVELTNYVNEAENLHTHSSNFIKSAITPKLEKAMKPIEI